MAWSPVLELLGKEIRFEELDAKPYPLNERTSNPLIPYRQLSKLIASTPASPLLWLTVQDILRIHDDMIATFGGYTGVMHRGRVEAALETAFQSPIPGHDPFPTIVDKAASLLHSILLYHPFLDGQKRTGISAAFILLGVNGYIMWSRDPGDEVHFAIHVAKGEMEVDQIAKWIAARIVPPTILKNPEVVAALLPFAERATRACTKCHHPIHLDKQRVTCASCGSMYVVSLNAGLVPRGGRQSRPFVQAGLRRIDRLPPIQRTLDAYLARPEESRRRRGGSPQSRS